MDVGGRVKAIIKGEGSKPEWEAGTMAKNQSLPGRAEEKVFLDKLSSPLGNHHEHHDWLLSNNQGLAFSPLSTNFIVWAFNVRTQYTNLGSL